MAKRIFAADRLIGGTAGCLDDIDHNVLADENVAIVVSVVDGRTYTYQYDSSSTLSEDSPFVINPDSNSGAGRWILNSSASDYVYRVLPSEADQGAASGGVNRTVYDVATTVGTSKYAVIHFVHDPASGNTTTYTWDTSADFTTYPYLFFKVDPGVRFARTTGDEIVTPFSPENMFVSFRQQITAVDMIAFSVGGTVSPWWWGMVDDSTTDCTNSIQYAIDSLGGSGTIFFPVPTTSYLTDRVYIKKTGQHMIGEGGRVTLKYGGVGADETAIIEVDKTTYNSDNNYFDMLIKGFILDGDSKALYGLKLHGFTRRCRVEDVYITQAVCHVWATDSFYSEFRNVEFQINVASAPSGMTGAVYDAAKYGFYGDVCHRMLFHNCIWYAIGGDVSNSYTAALRLGSSENVEMVQSSFEETMVSGGRYLDEVIVANPSSSLHISGSYIENMQTSGAIVRVQDAAHMVLDNIYFNNIEAVDVFKLNTGGQLSLNGVFGENMDVSGKLFEAATGTVLYGVTFIGSSSFAAGSSTADDGDGAFFDASGTTNSAYGLVSVPIVTNNNLSDQYTGFVKRGYSVALGSTYVKVSPGEAIINGQPVQFGRNSGISQRLYPDLNLGSADTWNVRIGGNGSPYIELSDSVRDGDPYTPIVATFTTAGDGSAPAALSTKNEAASRIYGASVDLPKTDSIQIHRSICGSATLTDSGTAADTDLFTMSLSSVTGEDDNMVVFIRYVVITTTGSSSSVEGGDVSVSFTKDSGDNYALSTPVKYGTSQALDADMATMVVTFSATNATHVATVKVSNETLINSNSVITFTATIMGGRRATSTIAIGSSVTEGQ